MSRFIHVCKTIWHYLAILIVWLLFSYQYIFFGLIPFPSRHLVTFFPPWSSTFAMPVKNGAMPDVSTQIFPWKSLTIDSWKLLQLPLWNPYSFSGTHLAANYQSAIFSPVNILFLLFDKSTAWSLMILLQPLLAGLFMVRYIRILGLSRLTSVFSGAAWMFCGFMTVWMAYGTLAYAVLVLPFILLNVENYVISKRYVNMIGISLGISFSFLSGHFQMSLYVLGLTLFYTFIIAFRARKELLKGVIAVLLGLLFVSPQLFLSYNAFEQTFRKESDGKGESIPWNYSITLFSPDFYGNPVTRNDWFGHYAEWSSYVGVATLLLCVIGLLTSNNNKRVKFYICSALISLLLAYQSPLMELIYVLKIPVLSTSAASRIIVIFSFSLIVMSAYGLHFIERMFAESKQLPKNVLKFFVLFIILFWLMLMVKPMKNEINIIAIRNSLLPSGIFVAILFGLFLLKYKKLHKYILLVFVCIHILDLTRFASKWMPFEEVRYLYPSLPVISFLQEHTQKFERVFGPLGAEASVTYKIPVIEGYDTMYLARYGEFINSLSGLNKPLERSVVSFDKRSIEAEKALRLLGVKYIFVKKSDGRSPWVFPYWEHDNYQKVYEDSNFEVYENTLSYPRQFMVTDYDTMTDRELLLNKLWSGSINLSKKVIVEEDLPIKKNNTPGEVSVIFRSPNTSKYKIEAPSDQILFLSDVFEKGWKAKIDGNNAKIVRADYSFMGIPVKAGSHEIEVFYYPDNLNYAFLLSFSVVLYYGLLIVTNGVKKV